MRASFRSFHVRLGFIAAVALALRVIYILTLAPTPALLPNDTFWYAFVSEEIALGHGFVIGHGSLFSPSFRLEPTALHPPLYPLALAGLRELGVDRARDLLLLGAMSGTVSVLGVGLLGRALRGAGVGLLAAAIAAANPLLIVPDGALLSETLYGPALILVLAVALALARRPGVGWGVLLGATVGVAALVRSEALGLVVLLGLPLAWRGPPGVGRALRLVTILASALVVISPWVIRNENALGALTLSTNDGVTLAFTNCASTYYGPNLGTLDAHCVPQLSGGEAQQSAMLQRRGLHYATHHAGRLPVVLLARLARTWGLFHPFRGSFAAGRNVTISNLGVVLYYPLAALAIAGTWFLRRRRAKLWVLLAPILLTDLVVVATYGSLRERYLAELPLVLLAAVGAGALADRWRLRSRAQPVPDAAPI